MKAPVLVVGSTGFLGRSVVKLLGEAGYAVRALVRPGRDNDVTRSFVAQGVEVVRGDVKDAPSLAAACRGADAVVSTATATASRLEGDSIETVDRDGQLALVDAAESERVARFVHVSFAEQGVDFALQRAKRLVLDRLRRSSLSFTVLQPTYFIEAWLSPALGFDAVGGKLRIFGTGERPTNWISIGDVARFAVAAAGDDRLKGRVLPLGGQDALSPLDVARLFREFGAPPAAIERVDEATLQRSLETAGDSLAEAFAALMLGVARGQVVDAREALELVPGRLATVRDFATRSLRG